MPTSENVQPLTSMNLPAEVVKDVCIAGGGPAGMVLGLLLAKAGLRVLVLEAHRDFEREYRGEVLMPRFLQMMSELGLDEVILKAPHLNLENAELFYQNRLAGKFSFREIAPKELSRSLKNKSMKGAVSEELLRTLKSGGADRSEIEFLSALWMPQPFLLTALHEQARKFPNFEIWFDARVVSLHEESGKVTGVYVERLKEKCLVKASVNVGADGRFSILRRAGNFETEYRDYHFDIIWFTIPKPEGYDNTLRFYLTPAKNLLTLPKYPNHIQCGLVVEKGGFSKLKQQGIQAMRETLLAAHPMVHPFANALRDFTPFHVLQAELELLREWAGNGILLIGDAAHTCSPAGAIGVSVAVETAITAAGVIWKCFEKKDFSKSALGEVQKLREADIRKIHNLQKRFSGFLLTKNFFFRGLLPVLFPLFFFTSAFRRVQRRFAFLSKPLEIDPRFRF